jgi:hypothetical protein
VGYLRLLIRAMLLLVGLLAGGCASDDRTAGTAGPTDVLPSDGPSESVAVESATATTEQSDDADSITIASEPTTSARSDLDCPDTTTSTIETSSTNDLPSVCELIEEAAADEGAAQAGLDYVVWSGTISGSIQTPGCDAESQSGEIILVVFSGGDLSGAGETVSGAYRCDNGASIPEMTHSYGIDGRMTDVFTLTFSDGVQLVSDRIDGGHARVISDTGFGLVKIDLTCENC